MEEREDRDELVIRETITEEFIVDGEVVATEVDTQTVEVQFEHNRREREITVEISSGFEHRFPFRPEETVGGVVTAAVRFFASENKIDPNQPYVIVHNKTELNDQTTLEGAGVTPGSELLLTPRRRPVDGA